MKLGKLKQAPKGNGGNVDGVKKILIADVYLFEYDKLKKDWRGVQGKDKKEIEYKTVDKYIRDNYSEDITPSDDRFTIVVQVLLNTCLPLPPEEKEE